MKIKLIFTLLTTLTIGVLIASSPLPAFASLESCSSDNTGACVHWYFIDKNGAQIDEPSPVLIDTTHAHETTIKWNVEGETGSGSFQFKTIPHVSKGTPGMIENCKSFPIEVFNGSAQTTRQYECTIKADGDIGLGTVEVDLAVNNGRSLPFYDTSNHFVGTSFQYSTDVVIGKNVIPEFGQISTLVLIVSITTTILILAKTKKSMIHD